MISYSHRQPGFFLWLTMIVAAVFIFSVTKLMSGEAPPDSRVILRWIPLATAAVLLVIGWLFGSLTVTIDEEKIVAAFGPGWPRKTVRLASVHGVRPVRNSWWYGWGIRYTPHGWLYNVSGLDAVELELTGGRSLRIGTDEPAKLAAAIAAAAGTAG
ncbi:MAG: hypothetical protein OES32_16810 [Acidobacteriota bacterium]|nr:hypothetical protein [Acidobacteriota bacterium]MDH3525240.1 hypothetical protein [Acidobacteriota bacterium]